MLQITKDTAIELITTICNYSHHHDSKIENMLYEKSIIKENFQSSREWVEFLKCASEETITMILEYI